MIMISELKLTIEHSDGDELLRPIVIEALEAHILFLQNESSRVGKAGYQDVYIGDGKMVVIRWSMKRNITDDYDA